MRGGNEKDRPHRSRIKELHPYDTPEFIAVDIEKGYKGYLDWILDVT